jgi:RNA polymerase sigma factor (sigma-70 family)
MRYLRAVPVGAAELSDRDLLARFTRERDGAAFAALVGRHGGAVWAACARLLDREEDAEDAFQAVFLTLARKAASVGDCLPAWLHGVARRVAANVRREVRRRSATENAARVPEARTPDVSWREGLALLDEELANLPERYRAVLIACCLEGRSRDEAARTLGWTASRVKGLLERGRELLRQRLARRGFDLGAVLLAATVTNSVGAVPSVSVEFALYWARGQGSAGAASSAAVALSERVVSAMFVQKLKAAVAVLIIGAVAVGGALTHRAAGGTEPVPKTEEGATNPFAPGPKTGAPADPFAPTVPKTADPFTPASPKRSAPQDVETPLQKVFSADTLDPKMLRELGNRFAVEVLGRTDGACSGTELYFYDSDLGTAAVHAGLVKAGEKAVITVTVVKCPKVGAGSTRNGVKSLPWDAARPTDTALLLLGVPERAAEKNPEDLTVEEAVTRAKPNEKVKVVFEVASVEVDESLEAPGPTDWRVITFNPKSVFATGVFRVHLIHEAATPVFKLGLVKSGSGRGVDYFRGKTVRVTGTVERVEHPVDPTVYRILVSDIGNLEVIK